MIPSSKYLKNKAGNRIAGATEPQKIALVYGGITFAASLLVTGVRYALAQQIAQTGGLHGIGMRSILSTADNILPIAQTVLMLCLNLGLLAAMLRIARRQYASPKTLKAGVERFWVLLRVRILQTLIYMGAGVVSFYISTVIFMVSPFSRNFMAIAEPLVTGSSYTPQMLLDNPELLDSIVPTMVPLFVIYALLYGTLALAIFYRYRLVDYMLIDNPGIGANLAMRQSQIYMRNNKLAFFKLDLSYWWYYLLQALASSLLYTDLVLAMLGVDLPFSDGVIFFGTCVLYLLGEFAVIWFFKIKVEVTYALAYDIVVPRPKQENTAVLGNIFQM